MIPAAVSAIAFFPSQVVKNECCVEPSLSNQCAMTLRADGRPRLNCATPIEAEFPIVGQNLRPKKFGCKRIP